MAESAGEGGPERLPRGPHGLSREIVAENQRRRLLGATVETVAERGFDATTIAQITASAALSRRTFYEHFANKEDCFSAAHAAAFAELCETMEAAASAESEWSVQVRAMLGALLALLAAEPDLARFFFVGSLGAGDQIAERHHDAMQRLIGLLVAGAPERGAAGERSGTREQTLAGGLSGLIVRKINAAEGARLSELLPALTELLLRPYLGDEESMRVAGREEEAEQS